VSDEENIETNPFFEVVRDSVAQRDSIIKKDEAEQKKAYQEHQKILSQSKTHLANDVRSAIKDIPPMKLNVEGSIEFESEAFAWMIRDDKPNPLNGEENKFIYAFSNGIVAREINSKGSSIVFERYEHTKEVNSVCYSPDGKTIASGSADKTIRLWNAQTGAPIMTLTGHEDAVLDVCFSPDGKTIASGSSDKTLRLWDAQTGSLIKTLTGHHDAVTGVCFSPDGTRIASVSWDNTIRLWNAKSGAFVKSLVGIKRYEISYSADGMLFANHHGTNIKIIHAETGEEVMELAGHPSIVRSISFSPDGTSVASCCKTEFRLWDLQSGEYLVRKILSDLEPKSVCYTADGNVIIIANKKMILYNTRTHNLMDMGLETKYSYVVSSTFREASEVFNILKETNKHLMDLGFELTTDNGLEFILSWNQFSVE